MSLEIVKEKIGNLSEKSDKFSIDSDIIIMHSIMPFSRLIKNQRPLDIYSGEETIPFEQRDPLFKSILRKEFSNAIKEFSTSISDLK